MPLHYRHGFHSRLADLNKLLRYLLGGYRPSKTTCQILSPAVFAVKIRMHINKEWYFTDEYRRTETLRITSPTYATQYQHTPNIKL